MATLDIYNTHMELYPYKQFDQLWLEKQYTAKDKFTDTEYACGYIINDNKMYLPRGTSVSKLQTLSGCQINEIMDSDPIEPMSRRHSSYYEPRNNLQSQSIDFLKGEGHQLGLNLKTGWGKAVPLDTKIPAPVEKGFIKMGDIKVGDTIFNTNGDPTTVTSVFPQGSINIYEITFSDGRTAKCCANHLWTISDYKDKNRYYVLPLKEIYKDYKTSKGYKYYIPTMTEPVKYPTQKVYYDPYMIGVLAASDYQNMVPCFKDDTGYIIDKISRNIQQGTFYYEITPSESSKGWWNFHCYDTALKLYSKNVILPNAYLYNDINIRLELIRGLFDEAGAIIEEKGTYKILFMPVRPSLRLLKRVRDLLLGFGYFVKMDTEKGALKVSVPHSHIQHLFTLPEMVQFGKDIENIPNKIDFYHLKIVDIKEVYQDEAQCITVDDKNHMFLTEGFLPTHNTFCVAYASTELQCKTLIITPNTGLKNQWIKTYRNMFDYRPKELLDIAGSPVMEAILNDDARPADIYFVNHQTLRSFLAAHGPYKFKQFFEKLGIGIKVYDESHMEFANILLVDFLSNTDRTWYLTATFDRSDDTESICFKRAFATVDTFGKQESAERTKKHVIYHIVNINSKVSPQNRAKLMAYPGFSSAKYGKYAIFDDPNNTAYRAILAILKKTTTMEGKILIFLPLIDAVDEVVKRLKRDYPVKSVAAYHSKIDKDEKESAEKKDIIVSTIKSCGTGRDIKGLRCVISLEPVASKVVTEQTIGRLRPYADDKDTYFFDIISRDITPLNWWHRSRFKVIPSLVKEVVELNDVLETENKK